MVFTKTTLFSKQGFGLLFKGILIRRNESLSTENSVSEISPVKGVCFSGFYKVNCLIWRIPKTDAFNWPENNRDGADFNLV